MTEPVRIAVTRLIPEAGLALLREAEAAGKVEIRLWQEELPPSPQQLADLLRGCAGALTLVSDHIDGAVLDREPQLTVVSNFAVGYDNVDVPAATARGVAVCNTPDVLTQTTADFAFALMMAAARRIVEAGMSVRDVEANPADAGQLVQQLIHLDCSSVLHGFGRDRVDFDLLKDLPVVFLRIDSSIIFRVLHDESALATVKSITRIAHTVGINTIADLVESDEMIAKLREVGVDYAHGVGIGIPVPLSEAL